MLVERSNPKSKLYQQWLSYETVGDFVTNDQAVNAVKTWIETIHSDDNPVTINWISPRKEYMKISASLKTWEAALNTKFFLWKDHDQLKSQDQSILKTFHEISYTHILAKEYSIPGDLYHHIDSVFNLVDTPLISQRINYEPIEAVSAVDESENLREPKTLSDNSRRLLGLSDLDSDTVTIKFLNSYYRITSNIGSTATSQSIFSTNNEYYSSKDLESFQTAFNITKTSAIAKYGYNAEKSGVTCSSNCNEGNLDLQYIMAVAQRVPTFFWQSYKSSDPLNWILNVSSTANPPTVHSISWIYAEAATSRTVMRSFNIEAMKLGLIGVTILAATGDDGVASRTQSTSQCKCTTDSSSNKFAWSGSSWSGQGYFPNFPCSSPYVTAVGATMGPNRGEEESTCQSDRNGGIITSGGGFSTFFAQPSWQTQAIDAYFNQTAQVQPKRGYNRFGRGYPDISLLGTKYATIVNGDWVYQYGTSASTPVLAGMISLINSIRLKQNMSTVGFINPSLYSAGYNGSYGYFKDISTGGNFCCSNAFYPSIASVCCASGFNATSGWDPATGWGSIDFPSLQQIMKTYANNTETQKSLSNTAITNAPTASDTVASSSSSQTMIIAVVAGVVGGLSCLLIAYFLIKYLQSKDSPPAPYATPRNNSHASTRRPSSGFGVNGSNSDVQYGNIIVTAATVAALDGSDIESSSARSPSRKKKRNKSVKEVEAITVEDYSRIDY